KDAGFGTSSDPVATPPLVYVPFIYGEVSSPAVGARATQAPAGFASVPSAAAPAKSATSAAKPEPVSAAPHQPKADTGKKPVPQEASQKTDDISVTLAGPESGLQIALRGPAEPSTE